MTTLRVPSHEWKFIAERNNETNHNCKNESKVITAELGLVALFRSAVNFHLWDGTFRLLCFRYS